MQALLETATRKDGRCPPTAPAWGRDGSARVGRERKLIQHTPKGDKSTGGGTECFPEASQPETPQRQPPAPKDLTDFSAGTEELERARLVDLRADRTHVQELRALVRDVMLKGCSGSQEGYMAELLVQVQEKCATLSTRIVANIFRY